MNLLDWECSACGAVRRDLSGFTSKNPPTCQSCPAGASMEVLWNSSANISAWERPMLAWDENGKDVECKSIADVRRMERESEKKAANGEGSVVVARQFSQDDHNKGDRVFGGRQVKPHPYTRSGQKIVVRRGTRVVGEHGRG